ncbi:hypothetical protein QTO34_008092 [Cnephaeus nilssonii]|uniref:HAT C-terminal dimerisation domain-containing protein n=1 Tax=Cnephaeus nilssonii TaxID=3371016 RepID=A0AA40LVY3_CNENI|nr:hypothetical protein QTO34_008092 [Eptesicus nilssonii]
MIRIWETFLSLMMINLSVHINELNLKLQGFGKSIDVMFGYIKALESKVKIFKRDYFEKASAAVQNEMELLHMKYQHVLDLLLDQFSDRFSQFRSLEQTMKINKYPDVVVYKSGKVPLGESKECHYEQEIWSAWNRLPDTFSTLKNIAMALLTIFPSTYFCEALISALNNIKTNKRNRLTDEVSNACLGLKAIQRHSQQSILVPIHVRSLRSSAFAVPEFSPTASSPI